MSEWTHSLCRQCWNDLEPGRTAVRVREPEPQPGEPETCCRCDTAHRSGIYYRAEPEKWDCTHD